MGAIFVSGTHMPKLCEVDVAFGCSLTHVHQFQVYMPILYEGSVT